MSLHEVGTELRSDRLAYLYIGGATAFIFAMFGYLLGRKADRLAQLSETDPLTDLLNARGFSVRLDAEVKRAKPLSPAFKPVVPRSRRVEGHQRSPRTQGRQ
jgi:hypothetical protein